MMDRKNARRGRHLKRTGKGGLILYFATVVFSVLFLFVGNKFAADNLSIFDSEATGQTVVKAKITKITNKTVDEYSLDGSTALENIEITFKADILSGDDKGKTVTGLQNIDSMYSTGTLEAEQGDTVLMLAYEGPDGMQWQLIEFVRTDKLLVFGIIFMLALLLFGRIKGFNTILSLVFTCGAVFAVFIPAILSGKNIYASAVIICLFVIVMTYLIVNGGNKKTLAAVLGCIGGLMVSGLLTVVMDKILALTGYVDEESIYLTYITTGTPINLRAIIFAAILIGALGAVMDVAMSISTSLWEVKERPESASFNVLYKSGMNIGRDIMGTMANTLILAYIGSSLSIILLLSVYSTSLTFLLNREMIVVEILQALVGSFGILITMPLTSLICAAIYSKAKKSKGPDIGPEERPAIEN